MKNKISKRKEVFTNLFFYAYKLYNLKSMKHVKVYRDVIDELDMIKEIIHLLEEPMPENSYNFLEFKLSDIEYEDENHIFHFSNDVCKKALESLNFTKDLEKDYIYRKGDKTIAFISLYKENKFIIQRQS